MFLRSLVVVGLVGLASLAAQIAQAEAPVAFEGVSFTDAAPAQRPRIDLSLRDPGERRFADFGAATRDFSRDGDTHRGVELALVASSRVGGVPVDVSFAQTASIGVSSDGDISRQGRGSELRLGRGLRASHGPRKTSWDSPAWYIFAASDDEALTWTPGVAGATRSGPSFAVQDRVEIGDMQAGVTYEAGGLQASLAYVERDVSVTTGARTVSQDESFTGFTLTYRH